MESTGSDAINNFAITSLLATVGATDAQNAGASVSLNPATRPTFRGSRTLPVIDVSNKPLIQDSAGEHLHDLAPGNKPGSTSAAMAYRIANTPAVAPRAGHLLK